MSTSIRKQIVTACSVGLLLAYTSAFLHYAPVFRNELSLWLYTAQRAPLKPRPHIQLALALMERQRFREAQIVLDHVTRILSDPTVRLTGRDRIEAVIAVKQDRLLLSRAAGTGTPWR